MKGFKNEIRKRWYLRWMLLLSNWTFQGVLHADKTEKIYRIFTSVVFTLICYLLIKCIYLKTGFILLVVSFILGHTINWLLNGNFTSIFVHRLFLTKVPKQKFFDFLNYLKQSTDNKSFILYAAAFGSLSRGELKETSDLDISIVRKPGIMNAIQGLWLIFCIKKKADFKGIPVEIFLNDSPHNSIKRYKDENIPVVLSDPHNTIKMYYDNLMNISDSIQLNQ